MSVSFDYYDGHFKLTPPPKKKKKKKKSSVHIKRTGYKEEVQARFVLSISGGMYVCTHVEKRENLLT